MRIIVTLIVALVIGGGGTFLWLYFGGFKGEDGNAMAFINAYGEYVEVVNQVESMVHLPGTEGNANRAELLALLNSILTEDIDPVRRESLTRLAFSNLDVIKKEIDSAQIAQSKLYQVLQDLDTASRSFKSIELRNRVDEIVQVARKRAELSSRITSIHSETNEHTYAIITRILVEKGELSQEHIREINEKTAVAEDRFAVLEGLYTELEGKKAELDVAFAEFVEVAL